MQSYGQVQEGYLSPEYRLRLSQAIEAQGEAAQILSLELHGNNYSMFEERYSLTPEIFYSQVEVLLAEGYHFATIHEVEGFVYGWFPYHQNDHPYHRYQFANSQFAGLHRSDLQRVGAEVRG